MGGTRGTHGRTKTCVQSFDRKNPKGSDHSEDLDVDGSIL